MQLTFQHKDATITLHVEEDSAGWRVRLPDGSEHHVVGHRLPGDLMEMEVESRESRVKSPESSSLPPFALSSLQSFRVPFARPEPGAFEFSWEGETYLFVAVADGARPRAASRKSGDLAAPMVGVVADVLVEEGQQVESYQPLVVVEAMKVMATLEAPFAGTVRRLHVKKGDRVTHGGPVVEVEPHSEG